MVTSNIDNVQPVKYRKIANLIVQARSMNSTFLTFPRHTTLTKCNNNGE